jgi:hypothetical protein
MFDHVPAGPMSLRFVRAGSDAASFETEWITI